jgi:PIN domain nuclease of toxin-antitoxin system
MAVPLLDTHAWIWWIEGDRRLSHRVRDTLDRLPRDERPYLSAISLWEVAMLVERGRVAFSVSLSDWLDAAAHARSVRLVPITAAIAAQTAALPTDLPSRSCRPAHRRELSRARPPLAHPRHRDSPRTLGQPLDRTCLRSFQLPVASSKLSSQFTEFSVTATQLITQL